MAKNKATENTTDTTAMADRIIQEFKRMADAKEESDKTLFDHVAAATQGEYVPDNVVSIVQDALALYKKPAQVTVMVNALKASKQLGEIQKTVAELVASGKRAVNTYHMTVKACAFVVAGNNDVKGALEAAYPVVSDAAAQEKEGKRLFDALAKLYASDAKLASKIQKVRQLAGV